MEVYNVDIRAMDSASVEKMIADFVNAGWTYNGDFYHGENNFHHFIEFVWEKDSDPVVPDGYKIP